MGAALDRLAVLADLRARVDVRQRGGSLAGRVSTEIPALDAWIGGWPRPGIVEIAGVPGAGRLGLVLPRVAHLTRRGRPVVVIDAMEQLFAPGWACPSEASEEGVDLAALWVVRPGLDRAGWAAEQVARSGAVELVVLLDAPPLGRHAMRLGRACELGSSTLVVVAERAEAELPAAVRLEVLGAAPSGVGGGGTRVSCTRSRDGRHVGERLLRAM